MSFRLFGGYITRKKGVNWYMHIIKTFQLSPIFLAQITFHFSAHFEEANPISYLARRCHSFTVTSSTPSASKIGFVELKKSLRIAAESLTPLSFLRTHDDISRSYTI